MSHLCTGQRHWRVDGSPLSRLLAATSETYTRCHWKVMRFNQNWSKTTGPKIGFMHSTEDCFSKWWLWKHKVLSLLTALLECLLGRTRDYELRKFAHFCNTQLSVFHQKLHDIYRSDAQIPPDSFIATDYLLETTKGDEKLMLKVIFRLLTQSSSLKHSFELNEVLSPSALIPCS